MDIFEHICYEKLQISYLLSSPIFKIIGRKFFSANDYVRLPYCTYTRRNILLLSTREILLLFFGGVTAVWRFECMTAYHDTA